MKPPHEQRRELSILARHFDEARRPAHLLYGILLTLLALVVILSSMVA